MVTRAVLDGLFEKSGAGRWDVTRDEFAEAVQRSVGHVFPVDEPPPRALERYLAGLHIADLALAAACALGRPAAWDHFVLELRPVLYRAADALDPTGGARELADSLYADLYGLRAGETRGSLLRYFHGRSSLATWLRAVLSQRYVDRLRSRRRIESLPAEDEALQAPIQVQDPDRRRLVPLVQSALRSAVDRLPAKDRLRLRSYHVAGMTLAQIGRLVDEHEATVSRHLARIRRELRAAVERQLLAVPLTDAEVARAFELAVEDVGRLDIAQVFEAGTDRKESSRDRSKYE
jgi:RNA polymerase sigma-70 factor (ECF subfamily)